MADPQIITTLRRKRDEIEAAILAHEARLKAARVDLAHVNATLHLFETDGDRSQFPAYVDTRRLFKPREVVARDELRQEVIDSQNRIGHEVARRFVRGNVNIKLGEFLMREDILDRHRSAQ